MKRLQKLLAPYSMRGRDVPESIYALAEYAARNPGLEFGNYGNISAYRSEARRISRQLQHVARSIESACLCNVNNADIEEASRLAYSGRLSIEWARDDQSARYRIDYCTGQYWPTEYRAAVAAVLDQAISRK